jgi:SsrA-binding protein
MPNKKPTPGLIVNRRARHDYATQQTYEAGLVLTGAEVKSLRQGHGHLRGAYVMTKDGELWLVNATITPTNTNRNSFDEANQTRNRKLLVKTKELDALTKAKEQGLTIIPLAILNKKRFIKIQIATARGLKKYDKRENIKKRDTQRDIQRSLAH